MYVVLQKIMHLVTLNMSFYYFFNITTFPPFNNHTHVWQYSCVTLYLHTSVLRLGFSVANDPAIKSCSNNILTGTSVTHVLRHVMAAVLTWTWKYWYERFKIWKETASYLHVQANIHYTAQDCVHCTMYHTFTIP